MKKLSLVSASVMALMAAGCGKGENTGNTPQVVATGEAVALVNGKPISKMSVEVLSDEVNQRRGGNNVPEDKIVEELIKRELLRQEAEAAGMMKDPKFAAKVENAERMMLSQAAAERFISSVVVSDEDLKKEYDERVGAMKMSEFKARHILVETEQAAKDIIAKLDKGEKFDALAKKLSKDPGSKDKGGELGWFSPQQMVPPFSQAVAALKNGETTKTPVQSQFGWHVIQREDSRDQEPPPFDTVKDQIKSMLQTKQLQQHLTDLQAKAKIENKVQAKPAPAPAAPPADAPAAGKPVPAPAAAPVPPVPVPPPVPAPAAPAKK